MNLFKFYTQHGNQRRSTNMDQPRWGGSSCTVATPQLTAIATSVSIAEVSSCLLVSNSKPMHRFRVVDCGFAHHPVTRIPAPCIRLRPSTSNQATTQRHRVDTLAGHHNMHTARAGKGGERALCTAGRSGTRQRPYPYSAWRRGATRPGAGARVGPSLTRGYSIMVVRPRRRAPPPNTDGTRRVTCNSDTWLQGHPVVGAFGDMTADWSARLPVDTSHFCDAAPPRRHRAPSTGHCGSHPAAKIAYLRKGKARRSYHPAHALGTWHPQTVR